MSAAETSKTVNISVTEGDAVPLQSDLLEILNDDTILWMFGPKDTLISQIRRKDDLTSFLVTDDVGFRGRIQVDQKTGSLTIRNTRIRHSGQYKLSIFREKTTIKIFNVTVFGKSSIVAMIQFLNSELFFFCFKLLIITWLVCLDDFKPYT